MVKRFTGVLIVIFMITMCFPPTLTKVIGATNNRASISTRLQKSLTKVLEAINHKSSSLSTESATQAITKELSIPSLTQWVLNEPTNTLYAISEVNKTLYFINAGTMQIEKSLTFNGGPTDIINDSGKLYITIDDVNQIAIVDMASRAAIKTIYTSSDPYRIVKDGNKLYYTERNQQCDIFSYDLTTSSEEVLAVGSTYAPDLAINTDKHILYIGESGLIGSNMIYYSTTDNKVIGRTNYDGGNGFPYPKRNTLFDDQLVYYAARDFDPENPTHITGSYGSEVIFARYGFAFTNTAIYDSYTNELLGELGGQLDLVEISNRMDFYLYSLQSKSIIKIEQDVVPPVVNSVSPNTGSIKGGTIVNIKGTGFAGATEVYFGNNLGTNLIVNSDTLITVTVPPASEFGIVDINVYGPNGVNVISRSDRFTYTGFTVNATAINGRITGLLDQYNYEDTVTLTAVPAEGYVFENWTDKSGNILSTDPVYSFVIYDNVGLNPNFIDNCDIDRNGKVDILDLAAVAKNYNMKSSDINWVPSLDFNYDGKIDVFDLVFCSKKIT